MVYKEEAKKDHMAFYCDLSGRNCTFSVTGDDFAGYSSCYFDQNIQNYIDLIHVPDRPLRLARLEKLKEKFRSEDRSALNFKLNYRIKTKSGYMLPVQENGIIFQDNDHNDEFYIHSIVTKSDEPGVFQNGLAAKSVKSQELPGNSHTMDDIWCRNRELLASQYNEALALYGRASILAICLEQLPLFNLSLGRSLTDRIIEKFEQRLTDLSQDFGNCLRIGSNTFCVVVKNKGQAGFLCANLRHLCEGQGLLVEGHRYCIPLSFGGDFSSDKKEGVEQKDHNDVLQRAEIALDYASKRGHGSIQSYEAACTGQLDEPPVSDKLIRTCRLFLSAFHENRVTMAYQPVIDTTTNEIVFYESLLRVIAQDQNIIDAGQIAPALQQFGLIRVLDLFALKNAVFELMRAPDITLSVNAAQTTLTDPEWLDYLTSKLRQCPDLGKRLIIEIIESGRRECPNALSTVIKRLKSYGVRFALDDFGSGNANLSDLLYLGVDIIKIDKEFISCDNIESGKGIIEFLGRLADHIGIVAIGEGVETREHLQAFQMYGVKNVQGYLYGQPSLDKNWAS